MKSPGAQSSNEFQWFHIKMGHQDSNKSYQCVHVLTNLRNPTLHLSHIPQCTIQNRHVHISVLNCALWDMGQAHCGICEFWSIVNDEWKSNRFRTRPSFSLVSHCSATLPMMSALGTLNIHKSIPFSLQQIHASHHPWRKMLNVSPPSRSLLQPSGGQHFVNESPCQLIARIRSGINSNPGKGSYKLILHSN